MQNNEISYMCSKCSNADLEIVNGPMTISKLQLTEQIYSKFKNSRHSWPLKRKDLVGRTENSEWSASFFSSTVIFYLDLGSIESKLKQKLYKTFKQFMDDVYFTINVFREYYAENSNPEATYSSNKKEVNLSYFFNDNQMNW